MAFDNAAVRIAPGATAASHIKFLDIWFTFEATRVTTFLYSPNEEYIWSGDINKRENVGDHGKEALKGMLKGLCCRT